LVCDGGVFIDGRVRGNHLIQFPPPPSSLLLILPLLPSSLLASFSLFLLSPPSSGYADVVSYLLHEGAKINEKEPIGG